MSKTKQKDTKKIGPRKSLDWCNLALRYKDRILNKFSNNSNNIKTISISPPYKSKLLNASGLEVYIEEANYREEAESKISFLIQNPKEFEKLIKEDPSLLINDYVIKRVILSFQEDIYNGPQKRAKVARDTLNILGISVFVPSNAPRKYGENFKTELLKSSPGYLYIEVESFKVFLNDYYTPPYKVRAKEGEKSFVDKKLDIAEAFDIKFGLDMPEDLIFGERDKDITHIAIAFASYYHQIDFSTIKSIYFDNKQSIENELLNCYKRETLNN